MVDRTASLLDWNKGTVSVTTQPNKLSGRTLLPGTHPAIVSSPSPSSGRYVRLAGYGRLLTTWNSTIPVRSHRAIKRPGTNVPCRVNSRTCKVPPNRSPNS